MAGIPETSCLLRGQQCSSRGCSQEEAGRRIQRVRAAFYSQRYKGQFSTCRFFSLSAPARVQVGGETEGKELKGIPQHPAQLSPKESAGPNPEMRNSFLPWREQHLPDNCPQCCDIFRFSQDASSSTPFLRGSQKAAILEGGFRFD